MTPTDEQINILDAATSTDDNLLIHAYAGTGKSTMLQMIEGKIKAAPILYLAFNKSVAEDAVKEMKSTTAVRTFNGLGHRIWASTINKRITLDKKKTQNLLRAAIDELPRKVRQPIWESYWSIIEGVGLAKALGYVPLDVQAKGICTAERLYATLDEEPSDIVIEMIDVILRRSIVAAFAGSIDFNDQVYMPAIFPCVYPQFPVVMVDEAQDLNPTNHALLDKIARRRLIAVGDDHQSIYGFRGAMPNGIHSIARRFNCKSHELSISFRCPQAVVEHARWHVPSFKWHKPGGTVRYLDHLDYSDINNATFICRNNAPLFALAFRLLTNGIAVSVAGSAIGPRLLGQMKRLGDPDMSRNTLLSAIADWEAKAGDNGSKSASDLADCMRIFAMHGNSLSQAMAYAEHLFAQSGSVQLITGHKAKGAEYETVYHLDPHLIRSDNDIAEANLRYVIETRSLDQLYIIDATDIGRP